MSYSTWIWRRSPELVLKQYKHFQRRIPLCPSVIYELLSPNSSGWMLKQRFHGVSRTDHESFSNLEFMITCAYWPSWIPEITRDDVTLLSIWPIQMYFNGFFLSLKIQNFWRTCIWKVFFMPQCVKTSDEELNTLFVKDLDSSCLRHITRSCCFTSMWHEITFILKKIPISVTRWTFWKSGHFCNEGYKFPYSYMVSSLMVSHRHCRIATCTHYSDVIMGAMASQITSPTTVSSRRRSKKASKLRAQIKESIKALRHWPLWGEFTGDRWIPRTKGP